MISIAAAIRMAFKIVPTPGFSLIGIHKKSTTTLIKNVASPIVQFN